MDLFDVARSCFRRWYILLPLLLVTGWFSYGSYESVKPVYYSNATIGLSAPSTRLDQAAPGVPVPRNGLLDIGGATLIANMTALGLRDDAVVQRVVVAGGLPDYVARMFPVPATMPQIPLIMIEATAADPATATETLQLVITQADSTMRTLQHQARVPDDQMVEPFVVAPPSTPAAGMPSRTRSTIAIFVAGVGLSILIATVLDVLLTRLKTHLRQRRQRPAETIKKASSVSPQPDTVVQTNGHPIAGLAPADEDFIGNK